MDETTAVLKDTEEFITNVLGKLDLPPDIEKQRLELSQRLQKLLNKGDEIPQKPLLPPPDESTQEFYDDVSQEQVEKADKQSDHESFEELYDDVAGAQTGLESGETYDDVKSTETNEEMSETYDDVKTKDNSVKEVKENVVPNGANTTTEFEDSTYDDVVGAKLTKAAQNVREPKKVSDIKDKICAGYMEKYRTKGILKLSKWQRRYCVLSSLALYYYGDSKDSRQKGTIVLPSSGYILRKGSPSYPEVKDGKMCFELSSSERTYLFKVEKSTELENWIRQIKSVLKTELSEEDSAMIRKQSNEVSANTNNEEDTSDIKMDEDLYEPVDNFLKGPSHSSSETEPISEEMYEETEQTSVKESSASSIEAPALPSRKKPGEEDSAEPPPESSGSSQELVQQETEEVIEDFELRGVEPKPPTVPSRQPPQQRGKKIPESPELPPRPPSSQGSPQLPPRSGKSAQASLQPPDLPNRATPATPKKVPPPSPKAYTKTKEVEPSPPVTPAKRTEVPPSTNPAAAPPPIKTKPTKGEQFDYARVYIAMWNCEADDEDDLAFSRGNQLYIREKIPNSDWWVASLMDSPDIRVGLVPRNYIMPAYDM